MCILRVLWGIWMHGVIYAKSTINTRFHYFLSSIIRTDVNSEFIHWIMCINMSIYMISKIAILVFSAYFNRVFIWFSRLFFFGGGVVSCHHSSWTSSHYLMISNKIVLLYFSYVHCTYSMHLLLIKYFCVLKGRITKIFSNIPLTNLPSLKIRWLLYESVVTITVRECPCFNIDCDLDTTVWRTLCHLSFFIFYVVNHFEEDNAEIRMKSRKWSLEIYDMKYVASFLK